MINIIVAIKRNRSYNAFSIISCWFLIVNDGENIYKQNTWESIINELIRQSVWF
jgi:hypothetical protein